MDNSYLVVCQHEFQTGFLPVTNADEGSWKQWSRSCCEIPGGSKSTDWWHYWSCGWHGEEVKHHHYLIVGKFSISPKTIIILISICKYPNRRYISL